MRIAHISDLHLSRHPGPGEYNAKRILGYINYRLFRGQRYLEQVARQALAAMMSAQPELVLLTGDITQHGLDSEFDAAEALLEPLGKAGIPVIAVPGNHDIYGGASRTRMADFARKIGLGAYPDRQGIFHFDGVELAALAQGIETPVFFAYGRQDSGELRRARTVWEGKPQGVMRLACGHYPVIDSHGGTLIYFRGLRKADKLIAFCQENHVAGYFCGHNHKRFSAMMPGGCVQFAAPALSAVKHAAEEWVSVYECGPELPRPIDLREKGNTRQLKSSLEGKPIA